MAVSPSAMAHAVLVAVAAEPVRQPGESMNDYILRIETARMTAMWTYISANAQVFVASVSGVTVGAGVSGPGTGTIV